MKRIDVGFDSLTLSPDLTRTGSSKSFEERIRASVEQIGLAEPLKVAQQPDGRFVVIDGAFRYRAIRAIREKSPDVFSTVPVYVLDFERRYEIRFQSDIYQDLLPSQMAAFVEHLHQSQHVRKADIARYIGVSPATLRNYTGLWRLLERGGLFASVVELMDLGVLPASNPYAWLRLTPDGIREVITNSFAQGEDAEEWVAAVSAMARLGDVTRFPLKFIQSATDALAPEFYREDEEVRQAKRDFGLMKTGAPVATARSRSHLQAIDKLQTVSVSSPSLVLRTAASSLEGFLQ